MSRAVGRLRAVLPTGRSLPAADWVQRHRAIVGLLWLHAAAVLAAGWYVGHGAGHTAAEAGVLAGLAGLAGWDRLGRRVRSVLASLGLLGASGIFIHLSGGYVELHFHFFVMVAVIALYQDWTPLLTALG